MLPKEAATKGKRIMTVRSTFALTVLAALGLAAAHPAAAQTQVFSLPSNFTLLTTGGAGGFYLGNEFTDSATKTVTYLGFFDNGSLDNTQLYNKYDQVRLDDITNQTVVATADVSATGLLASAGTGFQGDLYYFVPATGPGIITAGNTYAIGIHQIAAFNNNFVSAATPTINDPNITLLHGVATQTLSTNGIPTYGDAGQFLDGANFSSAPEPAQTAALGLFGLGLGALVLKARKRKASGMAV